MSTLNIVQLSFACVAFTFSKLKHTPLFWTPFCLFSGAHSLFDLHLVLRVIECIGAVIRVDPHSTRPGRSRHRRGASVVRNLSLIQLNLPYRWTLLNVIRTCIVNKIILFFCPPTILIIANIIVLVLLNYISNMYHTFCRLCRSCLESSIIITEQLSTCYST